MSKCSSRKLFNILKNSIVFFMENPSLFHFFNGMRTALLTAGLFFTISIPFSETSHVTSKPFFCKTFARGILNITSPSEDNLTSIIFFAI